MYFFLRFIVWLGDAKYEENWILFGIILTMQPPKQTYNFVKIMLHLNSVHFIFKNNTDQQKFTVYSLTRSQKCIISNNTDKYMTIYQISAFGQWLYTENN